MEQIGEYLSKRTSLSLVQVDRSFYISALGVRPDGELNHEHEMFTETYRDETHALKVFLKLRHVLYACDKYGHYPTRDVLKKYAKEAIQ